MKTTSINRTLAGIVGLLTVTTLGVAQEAQAARVSAESTIAVENATLTLDGTSLLPLINTTVEGAASINWRRDSYTDGPDSCPGGVSGVANVPALITTARSESDIDCSNDVANLFGSATIETIRKNGEFGAVNIWELVSEEFTVTNGQLLDFSGTLNPLVTATIEGWEEGNTASLTSSLLATYEVFLNGEVVFEGPGLFVDISLDNENGTETFATGPIPFDALPGGVDYTFEDTGDASIRFFARREVSANLEQNRFFIPPHIFGETLSTTSLGDFAEIAQEDLPIGSNAVGTPEPSTLISLTAIGIGALASRNRRKNKA